MIRVPPLTIRLKVYGRKRVILRACPIERPPRNRQKTSRITGLPKTIVNNKVMMGIVVGILFICVNASRRLVLPLYPTRHHFVTSTINLLHHRLTIERHLPSLMTRHPISNPTINFTLVLVFSRRRLNIYHNQVTRMKKGNPRLLQIRTVIGTIFRTLRNHPLVNPLIEFRMNYNHERPSFPCSGQQVKSTTIFYVF